ncbi:hypothetical protein DFH27DRAFT_565726 [Peziza echinospora]|nr:hypothetical protein DFH27DRAFT_565726 [Peziza echinospora]
MAGSVSDGREAGDGDALEEDGSSVASLPDLEVNTITTGDAPTQQTQSQPPQPPPPPPPPPPPQLNPQLPFLPPPLPPGGQYTIYHLPSNIIPAVQGSASELVRLSPHPVPQSYLNQPFRPLSISFRPWDVQMISNPPSVGSLPPYQPQSLDPLTPEELCKLTEFQLFERHKHFLLIVRGKKQWIRNAEEWIEDVLAGVEVGSLDRGRPQSEGGSDRDEGNGSDASIRIELVYDRDASEHVHRQEGGGCKVSGGASKKEKTRTEEKGKEKEADKVKEGSQAKDSKADGHKVGSTSSNPQVAAPQTIPKRPIPPNAGPSDTEAGPSSSKIDNKPDSDTSDITITLPEQANPPTRKHKTKGKPPPRHPDTEHSLLASVGMYKTNDGKLWRWPGQRDMRYGEDLHMPRQPTYSGYQTMHMPKAWLPANADNLSIYEEDVEGDGDGEDNGNEEDKGKGEEEREVDKKVGNENAETEKDIHVEGEHFDEGEGKTKGESSERAISEGASGGEDKEDLKQISAEPGFSHPDSLLCSFAKKTSISASETRHRDSRPNHRPNPFYHKAWNSHSKPLKYTPVGFFSQIQDPPPQPLSLERLQLKYFVQQRRYKIELAQLDAQITVLTESIEEILGTTIVEHTRIWSNAEVLRVAEEKRKQAERVDEEKRKQAEQEDAKMADDWDQFLKNNPVPKWMQVHLDSPEAGDEAPDVEPPENEVAKSAVTTSNSPGLEFTAASISEQVPPLEIPPSEQEISAHLSKDDALESTKESSLTKWWNLQMYSNAANNISSDGSAPSGYLSWSGTSAADSGGSRHENDKFGSMKRRKRRRGRSFYDMRHAADFERTEKAKERFIDGFRNQIKEIRMYSQDNEFNTLIKEQEKKLRDAKGKGKSIAFGKKPTPPIELPFTEKPSPISKLPTEILIQILSIPRSTVQASVLTRVCKQWYTLVIPMIYSRVEFGDMVEDIESELLERYRIKRARAERRTQLLQRHASRLKRLGIKSSEKEGALKVEASDSDDLYNGNQVFQFREGNAVLAVMPVSIGIMRALCKPHIAKHLRWLAYRATSRTAFPNRDALAIYSGLDLTNLIKARIDAEAELLVLTRKAVRNFGRLETLVVDGGEEHITNALLATLKWSKRLRVLHLSAVNIRELQFVRGKGSLWWDHRAKKPMKWFEDKDEKWKGKMKEGGEDGEKANNKDKKEGTSLQKESFVANFQNQDTTKEKDNNNNNTEEEMYTGPRQTAHLSSLRDYEAGFSYSLEVLSLFRCGYHLTREKHTRKVNKKGIIQVAEEEELKASAHLIPLLRRCKNLKTLKIESSHMEPEAVLGSWAILNWVEEAKKDKPIDVAVGPDEKKTVDYNSSSTTANGTGKSELGPVETLATEEKKQVDDQPEKPAQKDTRPSEARHTDDEEGRVYLTFPKLESLTLRGCGFFRGFETPPTWISSRGYEKFFLTHRIKQLAWSGWILNRHLKLNNPSFVKVARHLGESLTALSVAHFYDDTKVNILPSEAHGVKFSMERFLALLSHLKQLEALDWKLIRVKMSQVLEVVRVLRKNNMRKVNIINIYGQIGVEEANEVVECLPNVKQLLFKWLIYPDDQLAKQVYRREEEEELAANEGEQFGDDAPTPPPGPAIVIIPWNGNGIQQTFNPLNNNNNNNSTIVDPAPPAQEGAEESAEGQALPLLPLTPTQASLPAPEKELFTSIEHLSNTYSPLKNLECATINFIYPRPFILSKFTDPELNFRLLANAAVPRPSLRRSEQEEYKKTLFLQDSARAEFVYAIRDVANVFIAHADKAQHGEDGVAFTKLRILTVGYFLNEKWMNVPIHFRRESDSGGRCTRWWVEKWDMPSGVVEWLLRRVGGGPWDAKGALMDDEYDGEKEKEEAEKEEEGGKGGEEGKAEGSGTKRPPRRNSGDYESKQRAKRISRMERLREVTTGSQPYAIYCVLP